MYIIAAALIISVYLLHLYGKSTNKFCKTKKRLDGKTILITGGTCGLGLQAAIDFSRRGARVIIACPFKEEGIHAVNEIKMQTCNISVIFKFLDLSSLQSVRDFAADIIKTEKRLDVLVNNAGVGIPGDFETADGINFIMQVNYYGHFLLTLLLLPLLKKTGSPTEKSRIVCLSSILHRLALSDVSKYNKTGYCWFKVFIYNNSKFSLVLFARELSKRLRGSNVVVNCVDPGLVATGIYNSVGNIIGFIVQILLSLFFKNQWEGAQTTLYAVLEDEAGDLSGQFFKNCEITRPRRLAYDDEKARILWMDSVKLVKLSDEELKHLLN